MTTSPKLDLDVPSAELAVLQTLWESGAATIRQLADVLYPGGQAAQYGTVQKLLERLEQRGCVVRDRGVWPHVFTPAVDRETLIGYRLRPLFPGWGCLVLLKLSPPPLVSLPVPGWRTSEPAALETPAAPRDAAEGQLAQLAPDPVPPARAEEPLAMMNVEDLALKRPP